MLINSNLPKVKVMLSGGVDSSVALAVLQERGYAVEAVFMKCWSEKQLQQLGLEAEAFACSWEDDQRDAELVAKKLGVNFEVWDFEDEYRQLVVQYMLEGYHQGITPNPDIMCNSYIKFGVFWQKVKQQDPDFWVASGHYARIIDYDKQKYLAKAKDGQKDQSYFLCRVQKEKLAQSLFPIGEFQSKAEVRKYAKDKGLLTANKKDSQGLCFVGKVSLKQMLLETLGKKPGEIIEFSTGKVLGQHLGAFLYTIGQRQGLGLAGGPWFVLSVDIVKNQVGVAHINQQEMLDSNFLLAKQANWLVGQDLQTKFLNLDDNHFLTAQVRYRQKAVACKIEVNQNDTNIFKVNFNQPIRAIARGQSVVVYDGNLVVVSGIIS